jgi:hypothetical protein
MAYLFGVSCFLTMVSLAGFLAWNIWIRTAGMGSGFGFNDRLIVVCGMDGMDSFRRSHPNNIGIPSNCSSVKLNNKFK